jgi:hypothetical protein
MLYRLNLEAVPNLEKKASCISALLNFLLFPVLLVACSGEQRSRRLSPGSTYLATNYY